MTIAERAADIQRNAAMLLTLLERVELPRRAGSKFDELLKEIQDDAYLIEETNATASVETVTFEDVEGRTERGK